MDSCFVLEERWGHTMMKLFLAWRGPVVALFCRDTITILGATPGFDIGKITTSFGSRKHFRNT